MMNIDQNIDSIVHSANDDEARLNIGHIEHEIEPLINGKPSHIQIEENTIKDIIEFCSPVNNEDLPSHMEIPVTEAEYREENSVTHVCALSLLLDAETTLDESRILSKAEDLDTDIEEIKTKTNTVLPIEGETCNNEMSQEQVSEDNCSQKNELNSLQEERKVDIQEENISIGEFAVIQTFEDDADCENSVAERDTNVLDCSRHEEPPADNANVKIIHGEANNDSCVPLPNEVDFENISHDSAQITAKQPNVDLAEEQYAAMDSRNESYSSDVPSLPINNCLTSEQNNDRDVNNIIKVVENCSNYDMECLDDTNFNPFKTRCNVRNSPPKCNILSSLCQKLQAKSSKYKKSKQAENKKTDKIDQETHQIPDKSDKSLLPTSCDEFQISISKNAEKLTDNETNQIYDSGCDSDTGNESELCIDKNINLQHVDHEAGNDSKNSNNDNHQNNLESDNNLCNLSNLGLTCSFNDNHAIALKEVSIKISAELSDICEDKIINNDVRSVNKIVSHSINNIKDKPSVPAVNIVSSSLPYLETCLDNDTQSTTIASISVVNGADVIKYSASANVGNSCDSTTSHSVDHCRGENISALEKSRDQNKALDSKDAQEMATINCFKSSRPNDQPDTYQTCDEAGTVFDIKCDTTAGQPTKSTFNKMLSDPNSKIIRIVPDNDEINESGQINPIVATDSFNSDDFNQVVVLEASRIVEELRNEAFEYSQTDNSDDYAQNSDRVDLTFSSKNCSPMNQSEAGPEVAIGVTASDLQCASKFFRDAASIENQFNKQLASSMENQCKLEDDCGIQDSLNSSGEQHFCPREERCAPEGTSSPDPKSLESSITKGSISNNSILNGSEVNELLKKQEQLLEAKFLRRSLNLAEKENAMNNLLNHDRKDSEDNAAALQAATSSRDALLKLVDQYKGMLASLMNDKISQQKSHQEATKGIQADKMQALEDLANVEAAFSDVHRKYERTKQIVEALKKNEETLKRAVSEYEDRLQRNDKKFVEMQRKTEEKIIMANEEFEAQQKSNERELTKMTALLKKAEMKIISLQESLDRKARENQELTQLCDDLISKVGS